MAGFSLHSIIANHLQQLTARVTLLFLISISLNIATPLTHLCPVPSQHKPMLAHPCPQCVLKAYVIPFTLKPISTSKYYIY